MNSIEFPNKCYEVVINHFKFLEKITKGLSGEESANLLFKTSVVIAAESLRFISQMREQSQEERLATLAEAVEDIKKLSAKFDEARQ